MEYQSFSIRGLLDSTIKGQVRIPAFQRGFVWDMDRVAFLMDSIYKRYPFGSLLFWRTRYQLSIERKLGPYKLPEPQKEYPIDYVLDGQQRLTSIFAVFQNELTPEAGEKKWPQIYFNIAASSDHQESQFIPLFDEDVDPNIHFPINTLFDPVGYRKATDRFASDATLIRKLDELQANFKEAPIPVQILSTEERSAVAIVFERVNRLGMKLDTLQLLSAWTWNEDFDLIKSFEGLKEELEEFGFAGIGENTNLILQCTSAILRKDPSPEKLVEINGSEIRGEFHRVKNGIKGAIDFLRTQLNVHDLKNLPYDSLLVPLSVFFAEPDGKDVTYTDAVNKTIKKWFWRSCFRKRYSSQTRRTMKSDIEEFSKLKETGASTLDQLQVTFDDFYFVKNTFRIGTANTNTFILMLCNNQPKSFLSGNEIDLEKVLQKYNRAEFHHIYPKAHLKDSGFEADDDINCLVNFAIINGAENRKISRKKPSEYKLMMAQDPARLRQIMDSAFLPDKTFDDGYDAFRSIRQDKLNSYAKSLMKI